MQAKLLGIQVMDFTTKTNDHIDGTRIFIAYKDLENENVIGTSCCGIFLPRRIADSVKLIDFISKTIEIAFNMKGKVVAISPVA
ncbi:MAG TPA: hypothetical protein VIK86_02145 [Candidatus Paceibacterota bacterium]